MFSSSKTGNGNALFRISLTSLRSKIDPNKEGVSVGSMPRPIKERIAHLRKEIAEINEQNLLHVKGGSKPPGAGDHERRIQRLQEILDELASLTDWKKT
jgi:hypothetical protein